VTARHSFYDLDREEIKAINKLIKKGYSNEEIRHHVTAWADELLWEDDMGRPE
jgi:hypothetical protein